MNRIQNLPPLKRSMVVELAQRLASIPGMSAVVLGGSYASGTFHEASDIDLGLYYEQASPFSIAEIERLAGEISVAGLPTVTGFYGWGPWVNGGAWIHTSAGRIDFLYRNLDQVRQTIEEAQQGIVHHDFDQQPTFGFYSVTYLAETRICIPLHDPDLLIAGLKDSVQVYPPRLKQKILADSLWSAEFTLLHARRFAAQGDVYNTAGCLTRTASSLTQALFALNEVYFLRDKEVMDVIARFPILPQDYLDRIDRVLAGPGSTAEELTRAVLEMERAWQSVVSIPGVDYAPKFQM